MFYLFYRYSSITEITLQERQRFENNLSPVTPNTPSPSHSKTPEKGDKVNSNTPDTNLNNNDIDQLIKTATKNMKAYEYKLKHGRGSSQNNLQKIEKFKAQIREYEGMRSNV